MLTSLLLVIKILLGGVFVPDVALADALAVGRRGCRSIPQARTSSAPGPIPSPGIVPPPTNHPFSSAPPRPRNLVSGRPRGHTATNAHITANARTTTTAVGCSFRSLFGLLLLGTTTATTPPLSSAAGCTPPLWSGRSGRRRPRGTNPWERLWCHAGKALGEAGRDPSLQPCVEGKELDARVSGEGRHQGSERYESFTSLFCRVEGFRRSWSTVLVVDRKADNAARGRAEGGGGVQGWPADAPVADKSDYMWGTAENAGE